MRPEQVFEGDGGLTCPDCGGSDETEFSEAGVLYRCLRCGEQFDVPAGDANPAESDRESIVATVKQISGANQVNVDRGWSISRVGSIFFIFVLLAAVIGGGIAYKPPEQRSDKVWRHYNSIVVFRDDDIQGYYKYDTLQQVNQIFLEEDVPVTMSVIPKVTKSNTPITEQKGFCDYLTQLHTNHPSQFEIALHGYTHAKRTMIEGTPSEFAKVPYEKQKQRIVRGKAIVGQCAGTAPTTFVPPMDTYDQNTVRALSAANFTTVSAASWFTKWQFGKAHHWTDHGVTNLPDDNGMIKSWTPTVTWYSEQEMEHNFDQVYENNGIYIQTFHYPDLDDKKHQKMLRQLIDHMKKKKGVKFMTLGQLSSHLRKGTIKKTDDGWKVLEPRNPDASRGPTVRTRLKGIWTQIARQFTIPGSVSGLMAMEVRRRA